MSSCIYLCPTSILKNKTKTKEKNNNSRAVERKTGCTAFTVLSTYSQDSAETAFMDSLHSSSVPKLLPNSNFPAPISQHHSSLITNHLADSNVSQMIEFCI